jgi:hypothetical protein
MVPRDRIARPPRRASTCRSTPELPRHGAGGGTCTLGLSRSAATCLCYSATPAWLATRAQGPGFEPGIFAFRARRVTCSTIPVRACTMWGGGPAPPPPNVSSRAVVRAHAMCAWARTDTEHLRFQLGYSGCQRAGAIAHRPSDRWRFPLRDKEKGPGVCQALECRRFGDGLPRVLSSHLQGLAERTRLGILDVGMLRHGVPARACPRLRGLTCCERADGHGQHGGRESTTSRRAVQATLRFPGVTINSSAPHQDRLHSDTMT